MTCSASIPGGGTAESMSGLNNPKTIDPHEERSAARVRRRDLHQLAAPKSQAITSNGSIIFSTKNPLALRPLINGLGDSPVCVGESRAGRNKTAGGPTALVDRGNGQSVSSQAAHNRLTTSSRRANQQPCCLASQSVHRNLIEEAGRKPVYQGTLAHVESRTTATSSSSRELRQPGGSSRLRKPRQLRLPCNPGVAQPACGIATGPDACATSGEIRVALSGSRQQARMLAGNRRPPGVSASEHPH